jgi:hypothetical protein
MNHPQLMEQSMQIAWDYLEQTGELGEPREASKFLATSIDRMIKRGTSSRLVLSNKAITAYRDFRMPKAPGGPTIIYSI